MHKRSRFSTAAVAGAVLGVAVLGGAPALAAWSKAGTGAGAAQATSLVTPTDVSATGASNTTMTITWSAANQLSGATYQVVRNGSTTLSCTSSPCTDSGLTAGTTYSYVVSSKIGTNWSKSAASVNGTTTNAQVGATSLNVSTAASVTAGTAYSVTLTAKRSDGTTDTTFSGSKTLALTGTATDNAPTGATATLPTTATFTNGVATVSVTSVKAVAATLNAAAGGINGSTTMTVNAAAPAGLLPTNLTVASASPTCSPSSPVATTNCGPYVIGNNNNATFLVTLIDTYGNVAKATSTVSVAGSRLGSQGTLSASPMTIATGASSTGQWTYTATNGNWTSETLRFTASTWTLNITVTKQ